MKKQVYQTSLKLIKNNSSIFLGKMSIIQKEVILLELTGIFRKFPESFSPLALVTLTLTLSYLMGGILHTLATREQSTTENCLRVPC